MALSFEIDRGHAFSEKYGRVANDHKALDEILDDVTGLLLLGSEVYSRWMCINHRAYDTSEILRPENRAWFLLALGLLAQLSEKDPSSFQGTFEKLQIVSSSSGYGPIPEPSEEVDQ